MPTQYLMAIAIGPVQEFIASARRSRDLWFGSWLLSELSKAAAKAIAEEKQENLSRLIFPCIADINDLLDPDRSFNVVNKLLALIETDDPSAIGKKISCAIYDRLRTIRNQAWQPINGDQYFQLKTAKQQVRDLPEFFWAAVQLDAPQNYERARDRAEALLAARKTTRNFQFAAWGKAGVPKSSLDGLRESVIDEKAYPERNDEAKVKAEKIRDLFEKYHVREGERLCGVGLLKRLGNRRGDDSFFSTSHVAALPLMCAVNDEAKVRAYIQRLKDIGVKNEDLHGTPLPLSKKAHPPAFIIPADEKHAGQAWDGHILFEERLREYFDTKTTEGKQQFQTAKEALRDFLKDALPEQLSGQAPIPYYALLLADGDRMGSTIKEIKDIDRHRTLSEELSKFAGSVRATVENRPDDDTPGHQGSLVYAGGDDVLAFVPLHRVLACAKKLGDDFREKLKGFDDAGKPPTLSVGIAIAHHLEPLSDTLELARSAEKAAKSVKGKDALCVKVSKRGGSVTTVQGKWDKLDERLSRFIKLHREDDVPDGAAYELRQLAEDLKHFSAENKKEAIPKEVNRILKRKRARHGEQDLAAKEREKIVDELKMELEADVDGRQNPLQQLADELIVARLFADAMKQAEPKAAPETNEEDKS